MPARSETKKYYKRYALSIIFNNNLEKRVQGFKGSRIQEFYAKNFISAFNILSIFEMSFFIVRD